MSNDNDVVTIKADVFYAFTDRANQMSGKYQIDLGNLSVAAQAALENLGLNIRQKETQGDFITCKSKFPIVLLGNDNAPIEVAIGNGSKGVFKVSYYNYKTPQGQKGVAARLLSGRITELVEYVASDADITDDDLDEAL